MKTSIENTESDESDLCDALNAVEQFCTKYDLRVGQLFENARTKYKKDLFYISNSKLIKFLDFMEKELEG